MGRTIYLELVPESRMATDIMVGGVFLQDKTLAVLDLCTIIVFNDGGQLELPSSVVYVDGNGGVGLELVGFDADLKAKLTALIAAAPLEAAPEPAPALDDLEPALDLAPEPDLDLAPELGLDLAPEQELDLASESGLDLGPELDLDLASALELAPEIDRAPEVASEATSDATSPVDAADAPPEEIDSGTEEERQVYKSLHIRLRGLTLVEQLRHAKNGDATERMLLERMYGKNVWEALLRNPRLTAPEVARIARMGALPRPQLEQIVNNGGWLQIPEVRRALLTNPRLGTDQILRVLRLMPKHELKLASVQTVYTFAVRDAAKRMIKDAEK